MCRPCILLMNEFFQFPLCDDTIVLTVEIFRRFVLVGTGSDDDDAVFELTLSPSNCYCRLVVSDKALDIPYLCPCIYMDKVVFFDAVVKPGKVFFRIHPLQGIEEPAVISAQFILLFDYMGFKTLIGKRECRRHTGKAATDDQNRLVDGELPRFERFQKLGLRYGHAYKILSLFRGRLGFVHMHP